MQIVEGTRVQLTKPVGIWIGHMRYLDQFYGTATTNAEYLSQAKENGYQFLDDSYGPHIPEGATGTIRKHEMHHTKVIRDIPQVILRIKDDEKRAGLIERWEAVEFYFKEHIIFAGEEPPPESWKSWWMWGIVFDDWPVARDTMAGIGDKGLPDYLEVINDED